MESDVQAKGRVLVNALVFCLSRSRIGETYDVGTLRSILQASLGETWREGEFRLETLWKILCQQDELTPVEIAPPLLAFKEYENELGVRVRLPHALSAIPRSEQDMLRQLLTVSREEFLESMNQPEVQTESGLHPIPDLSDLAQSAAQKESARPAASATSMGKTVAAIVATLIGVVAVGASVYASFFNGPKPFDVSDTVHVLRLGGASFQGSSLVARIDDPRWDTMNKDDQKKITIQLFELEAPKGVRAMTLVDSTKLTRAIAFQIGGKTSVSVP